MVGFGVVRVLVVKAPGKFRAEVYTTLFRFYR